MKKRLSFVLLMISGLSVCPETANSFVTIIRLPEPHLNSSVSLEQAIENRRSVRDFTAKELKIEQIGQLCWSAQGITDPNRNLRAAPSAMAIYPMQLNVVLTDGLYIYDSNDHALIKYINTDIRPMLYAASFKQQVVRDSPCIFIISGSAKKIEPKFRGKGERFICLEAGHIAQNIHLQAVTLDLGSVPIGDFDPKAVAKICKLAEDMEPLYLVCVGNPVKKVSLESLSSPGFIQPPAVQRPTDIRTKKIVAVIAARRFNDAEFFGVQETLQIANVKMDIAAMETGEVKGLERNTITATMLIKDIRVDDYDAFVFIGGSGTREYLNNGDLLKLVRQANDRKKILAAINITPSIFAYADIVKGKRVASSISQRARLAQAGAQWQTNSLEIDGNLITAKDPDFAGGQDTTRRFGSAVLQMLREQNE
jgi:SagB-type dehydrogenase family enzyme